VARFPEQRWVVLVDQNENILGHVALSFRVWYEEGTWQGLCTELRVPSVGESPKEALDAVVEETLAYLNFIEGLGERENMFSDWGVQMREGKPAEPKATNDAETAPTDLASPFPGPTSP